MQRIRVVLGVAAVMVAMLIAFAGPAMADNDGLDCTNRPAGPAITCDHQRFFPVTNRFFNFCDDFVFDFNCGFGFGRNFAPFGLGFEIDQDIGRTGDVNIGLNVS